MSVTKELIEQERLLLQTGQLCDVHFHQEGSFLRAYDWSAWLCCRYLHDFKVNKRIFKGIEDPVAYIGFPETSLTKWMPEGAEQRVEGEKHLVITLPDVMFTDSVETMTASYDEWKKAIPLTEGKETCRNALAKDGDNASADLPTATTITAIMQRILAFPIESKSPIESMIFLADIKQKLAALI